MLGEVKNDRQSSLEEYIDIEGFAKGETLGIDLGIRKYTNTDKPLRIGQSQYCDVLRNDANVNQIIAHNIRNQRTESRSQKTMRSFVTKLPKVNDVERFDGYFAGKTKDDAQQGVDELLAYAKSYRGTPYRWGGLSDRGFDCSGFTQTAFKHVGINLPRTSQSQSQLGERVSVADAKPGDMVFFGRKRGKSYRTSHTGIVVMNGNGQLRVIHSSNRGVVEEDILSVQSYQRRFLFIKRIL
ncbi:MAG: hypothetical protein RIS47_2060 [Bacteroidota bacterium]